MLLQVNDKLFVGLAGLATDQQTLFAQLRFRHNMYKLCEERDMRPATFAHMVSNTLYEKRFGSYFCAPVIAGVDDDGTPFLAGMDTIGAMETAKDFMVQGTAPETLYGVCESFWRPGMVGTPAYVLTLHSQPVFMSSCDHCRLHIGRRK